MLLRAGLPVDWWWDAYETSNYLTVRLPTKTARGYMTPYEGVYGLVPDLSHLRIWGCKAYLKLPKNYIRKDWRDKSFAGYFVGYSEPGEMGYRVYIPDLKETVVGVNVTFNEVVPSYREEYYNELDKLKFEVAPDESTVDSFLHLVGEKYFDDDTLLEFITTRVEVGKGLVVAYRAPILADGRKGREEKSPIHVADVIRMSGLDSVSRGEVQAAKSSSRSGGRSDRADVPVVGVNTVGHKEQYSDGRLESGVTTNSVEPLAKKYSKRVRFDLCEFGEGPSQGVAETDVSADISSRSSEELRRENRSGGKSQRYDDNTKPCSDATHWQLTGSKHWQASQE